ncbi:TPA: replication protein [Salmonella enterica subsp. diarizonae serovar 61:r:z53]
MTTYAPTDAVTAIGQINFTGNVTPAAWWRHITLPSGRPDQTAITLLSEIVYWYRPAEVRNETTGELMGYRKRFRGDKLQRNYQAFADQFGFSKREATDALKRLRDTGLITLELRTVNTTAGSVMSNVLFIGVNPGAIAHITNTIKEVPQDNKTGTAITLKRNTPSVEVEPLLRPDVSDPTLKSETYTENTTKITTEIKNTLGASADATTPTAISGSGKSSGKTSGTKPAARQEYSPEFEAAWQAYPKRAGGNSKSAAWKHWKARLKDGVKPETMLSGVKRYAAYCQTTGNTGTQYVKQAATFFGPDRHFEESWQTPSAPGGGRRNALPISGFSEQDYGNADCNW